MNNLDVLKAAGVLEKQTRPLDMGEYASRYAGQMLQVWVNPPAVLEDFLNAEDKDAIYNLPKWRRVVGILFEFPSDVVQTMDDDLVLWLFAEGYRVYQEFHDELKKT